MKTKKYKLNYLSRVLDISVYMLHKHIENKELEIETNRLTGQISVSDHQLEKFLKFKKFRKEDFGL